MHDVYNLDFYLKLGIGYKRKMNITYNAHYPQ